MNSPARLGRNSRPDGLRKVRARHRSRGETRWRNGRLRFDAGLSPLRYRHRKSFRPTGKGAFRTGWWISSSPPTFLRPAITASAPRKSFALFTRAAAFRLSPRARASISARFSKDLPTRPRVPRNLRARLRHSAKRSGPAHLHRILRRLDPGAAARIAAPDTQKIIRALELRFLTKKPVEKFTRKDVRRSKASRSSKSACARPAPRSTRASSAAFTKCLTPAGSRKSANCCAPALPGAKPFTFIGYREILSHAPVGEGLQTLPKLAPLYQPPPSTKSANPRAISPNASKPGSPAKLMSTGYQIPATTPPPSIVPLQILAQAQSATP